ncbi:hypothetical protein [Embleya sp. MST-111070]|uniref:hypothetical protein n=1 Tax=Embleya sp. MST-111070 TaxID=3398231 RepID=UPI003F740647
MPLGRQTGGNPAGVDAALQWQDEHQVHGYGFGITVEPERRSAWAERPERRWEM